MKKGMCCFDKERPCDDSCVAHVEVKTQNVTSVQCMRLNRYVR